MPVLWDGSTSRGRYSQRKMGATGTIHINMLDESSVQSPLRILLSSRCHSPGVFRQLHLVFLHQQGGGNLLFLPLETELLFQLVTKLQILLPAVHIPGKMNIITDLLSHQDQTLSTQWPLNPEVTTPMFCLWGSPHVDLVKRRTPNLGVSSSRPPGPGGGRSLSSMAGSVGLHLSP